VPELAPHSDLVDVVPPDTGQGRPLVRLNGSEFSNIVTQLEQILSPYVYTQGAHLVRTTEAHDDGAIQRSDDALMLVNATKEWARKRFGEMCDFVRFDARQREWVPTAPSAEHINTV